MDWQEGCGGWSTDVQELRGNYGKCGSAVKRYNVQPIRTVQDRSFGCITDHDGDNPDALRAMVAEGRHRVGVCALSPPGHCGCVLPPGQIAQALSC